MPPDNPATITRLQGLLEVTRLGRSDADLVTILAETARILRETLGYGTVVINLHRPAWDDFWAAAVEGTDEARRALLGATYERPMWDRVLDPEFERRGAYLIRTGDLQWDDMGARWNPPLPSNLDPEAWQPEDELFVPFRHSDGHLLGVLSLGEPVSGRRPSDEELDVLVAVAGYAALAVQSAQEASEAAQHERALEELLRVSTRLVGGSWQLEDLLQAVCDGIRGALGFLRVAVALVDPPTQLLATRAATGWEPTDPVVRARYPVSDVVPLMDPSFEVAGCYLLPSEAAALRVPAHLLMYESENNGRGPKAWAHHWLLVPLRDTSENTIGLIWADDPVDLLLPSKPRLEALRTLANQAATAIESHEREAKLRMSEGQFRKVFEESPLGMVLVDRQLHVLDANEATVRMLGWQRAELRGRDVLEATHPDDVESERELLEGIFAGASRQYGVEQRCVDKDGHPVWVNLTASSMGDVDGSTQMVLRILEDVSERKRVQGELELAHVARRTLLKRVVEVAEAERKRIAADLHDGPIQRLSAQTIRLEAAKVAATKGDWDACSEALKVAQANLGVEIQGLRRLMKDLRPPVLDERGLVEALGGLAAEAQLSSSMRISVSASSEVGVDLEKETETALYRIAQEALTNVTKHARASTAWIALSSLRGDLKMEIGDDGGGFDAAAPPLADGHLGLVTMRERAEMAGGSLTLESASDTGTRVVVLIPHANVNGGSR